jgi:hypothetical protein
MIKQLCDIRDTVLRLRIQLRYGRLSRAPLRLLRLEWQGDHVDCDWIARPNDIFDHDLPEHLAARNASQQALEDALVVRKLLFSVFREITSADFRVYRETPDEPRELIIAGTVTRSEKLIYRVHSVVMQAKLCGFQFDLDCGKLVPFQMKAG